VTALATRRKNAQNPDLGSPAAVQAFLVELAGMILRDEVSARQAQALTAVANSALAAHRDNLSARLDELELEILKRRAPKAVTVDGLGRALPPAETGAALARQLAAREPA
jgi:hypothetical protein